MIPSSARITVSAADYERRVRRWLAAQHSALNTSHLSNGGPMQSTVEHVAPSPALKTIDFPRIGAYWAEHGGHFAGIIAGGDGPDYLLIVGPDAPKSVSHPKAVSWAHSLKHEGFADWDLPNRNDGAVLFGNVRALFTRDWYWLDAQFAGSESSAWSQYFDSGCQYYGRKTSELRARAVRRLVI